MMIIMKMHDDNDDKYDGNLKINFDKCHVSHFGYQNSNFEHYLISIKLA